MLKRLWLFLTLSTLIAAPATAQSVQSVLQTTATAMGMENLTSIEYSGTGWQGRVGQNVPGGEGWVASPHGPEKVRGADLGRAD